MAVRVLGATLDGIEGILVSVEVDAGCGLPGFHIVGQADRIVQESRVRVRAAFRRTGLKFPEGRVTVNLAPTGIPKTGSALDLPIAVGIACAVRPLDGAALARTLLLGELGLDGRLRPVRGALALVAGARAAGIPDAIVPEASLAEAAALPGATVRGAADLRGVLAYLSGEGELTPAAPAAGALAPVLGPDLSEVRGQAGARRALEVAAAGGHNLLLVGPPGAGKTLLARRLPGLLPDLDVDAALEVTRVHSVAGTLRGPGLIVRPPLRSPHHTTSDAGMTGGGRPLRPGEISLAHHGVLFLDELPEFRRPVLEALREPLEEGEVRLVRAHGAVRLPARFQLVAAMNPCPCGYLGSSARECRCDAATVRRYRAKLSGPLLDRIDLHVPVPALSWSEIASTPGGETSAQVRARVLEARERQARRYRGLGLSRNADLPASALRDHLALSGRAEALLEDAVPRLGLSMRAYVRVLRVARSVADLAARDDVDTAHVAEAVGFRAWSQK